MLYVLLVIYKEYKYIVQIDENEYIKIFLQRVVNKFLKRRQYISQAKQYNLVFIVSLSSSKDCLLFLVFLHIYSIVSVSNIDRDKLFSSNKSILQLVDSQKWVPILLNNSVKLSIVDIRSQTSILLQREQYTVYY